MKLFAAFSTLVVFLAILLGLAMLMAYPTMWLMNYLFTAQLLTIVFGASKITFWQAFALNTLFGAVRGSTSSSSKD